MAVRRSIGQILGQQTEKKEYFSNKYSFGRVVKLEPGMEVYCIPLNLENGLYEVACHKVKAYGYKNGFKSWFDTTIICKNNGEEGESGSCLACQLAKEQYSKYPDKNDYDKRIVKSTSYNTYLPVLILSCADTNKDLKKYPPTQLSIKAYQFAYLEMTSSSFEKNILTPFISKLKDEGIVDYNAEGEELEAQVMDKLQKTLIKISANPTNKKGLPYERSYSFILFSNQNIGAASGQYQLITQYNRVKKVHNDIVDFITMFDTEVDNICTSWTDDELDKYVNGQGEKAARVDNAVAKAEANQADINEALDRMSGSVPPKAEQVVTVKEDEDDFEMIGEEDFGSLDEVSTGATASTVEEDFEEFDDGDFTLDVEENFIG